MLNVSRPLESSAYLPDRFRRDSKALKCNRALESSVYLSKDLRRDSKALNVSRLLEPSAYLPDRLRRDSKAVMHWIANPRRPVRLRLAPPLFNPDSSD